MPTRAPPRGIEDPESASWPAPAGATPRGRQRELPASIARPNRAVRSTPRPGNTRTPRPASPEPRRSLPAPKTKLLSRGAAITKRSARVSRPGETCAAAVCRANSRSVPYSTPDGQTGSQARHPRQRSICVRNASDAGSSRPSTTAFMRWSRPRGESASSPSRTYVGHAGRQKPQWTQGSSRSRCASIAAASSAVGAPTAGAATSHLRDQRPARVARQAPP